MTKTTELHVNGFVLILWSSATLELKLKKTSHSNY